MKTASHAITTILVFCSLARAQNPVPTNEQVVIEAVRNAAAQSSCCDDAVSLDIELPSGGSERLAADGLIEALLAKGIRVSTGAVSADSKLSFEINGFSFKYEKGTSRGFLRKPMVRRVLDAGLRLTVSRQEDGVILKQEDLKVEFRGEFDPEFADYVKSSRITALSPEVPGSGWSKVVEPIVVTAAVGGLIYLFFANR